MMLIKIKEFIFRHWHWFVSIAVLIVVSALTVKKLESSRVYVFGPNDRVTVKIK